MAQKVGYKKLANSKEGYNLRSTWHHTIFDMRNTGISDRTVGEIILVTFR
jgi:hypothetical protein